jgi:hypothetical protein
MYQDSTVQDIVEPVIRTDNSGRVNEAYSDAKSVPCPARDDKLYSEPGSHSADVESEDVSRPVASTSSVKLDDLVDDSPAVEPVKVHAVLLVSFDRIWLPSGFSGRRRLEP